MQVAWYLMTRKPFRLTVTCSGWWSSDVSWIPLRFLSEVCAIWGETLSQDPLAPRKASEARWQGRGPALNRAENRKGLCDSSWLHCKQPWLTFGPYDPADPGGIRDGKRCSVEFMQVYWKNHDTDPWDSEAQSCHLQQIIACPLRNSSWPITVPCRDWSFDHWTVNLSIPSDPFQLSDRIC